MKHFQSDKALSEAILAHLLPRGAEPQVHQAIVSACAALPERKSAGRIGGAETNGVDMEIVEFEEERPAHRRARRLGTALACCAVAVCVGLISTLFLSLNSDGGDLDGPGAGGTPPVASWASEVAEQDPEDSTPGEIRELDGDLAQIARDAAQWYVEVFVDHPTFYDDLRITKISEDKQHMLVEFDTYWRLGTRQAVESFLEETKDKDYFAAGSGEYEDCVTRHCVFYVKITDGQWKPGGGGIIGGSWTEESAAACFEGKSVDWPVPEEDDRQREVSAGAETDGAVESNPEDVTHKVGGETKAVEIEIAPPSEPEGMESEAAREEAASSDGLIMCEGYPTPDPKGTE